MATKTDLAKKIGLIIGVITLAGLVFQAGMAYQDLRSTKADLASAKTRIGNLENEIGAIRENLRSFGVPLDPTKIQHMIIRTEPVPLQPVPPFGTKIPHGVVGPLVPQRGADAR